MTSLADFQGRPVLVVLSVRSGQATFESRTGWRSTHSIEDIRLWRPACRRAEA